MMAAQGDAVVDVQAKLRKEDYGQDVMRLRMVPSAATPAGSVARPHGLGPLLASHAVPERLLGAAVYVIGIVLARVQTHQEPSLRPAAFARLRTGGTVPTPVFAGLIETVAHFAGKLVGPRVGQRLIDRVQDALVLSNSPDVPAEVFAGLQVGAESTARPGHHTCVRLLARLAAKSSVHRMPSAPLAVLSDHRTILRRIEDSTP
jgi:hypothetical protein